MGKVIITGPGRSGTSFLTMLFTRLGYDTGFKPYREPYSEKIRAGCEYGDYDVDLNKETVEEARQKVARAPHFLKSPEWGLALKPMLAYEIVEVDHVFLTFRDFEEAAKSRIDAGLEWQVDDSLEGDERITDQANIHAVVFGRTIEACILWSIPCTVMTFPLLVEDNEYCYRKICEYEHVDRALFDTIYKRLANPTQIQWRDGVRHHTQSKASSLLPT